MNKKLFFALGFIFMFACNSQKDLLEVQNINKIQNYRPTSIIYNLPKTKIVVVVEIEKIIQSKGPYSDFTDKYLGSIKDVVRNNSTEHQISNINFYTIPIPDTSHTYVVSASETGFVYGFNLTKEGFIISLNDPNISYDNSNFNVWENNGNNNNIKNLAFNVLTSDKNYKIVYDTIYREEIYDTIIRRIPILKKNVILKTPEEQAEDLANLILTLRDDRAALFVGEGDNDNLPDGDALQIMINGINQLEKEYLSMFVGKTDTLKYTYTYSYIPEPNIFSKKIILFKFSKNSGVLPSDNLYGVPVFFEIIADNYSQNINDFQQQQFLFEEMKKEKTQKGLYYRIPEKASIRVLFNSRIISQKSIFVAQLGVVDALPASLFNDNIKIEFYPNLGSIKNIKVQ